MTENSNGKNSNNKDKNSNGNDMDIYKVESIIFIFSFILALDKSFATRLQKKNYNRIGHEKNAKKNSLFICDKLSIWQNGKVKFSSLRFVACESHSNVKIQTGNKSVACGNGIWTQDSIFILKKCCGITIYKISNVSLAKEYIQISKCTPFCKHSTKLLS